MYRIKYLINPDFKPARTMCSNARTIDHETNLWNKVDDRTYVCNDCGCRMEIHPSCHYEEEEVGE
jgi:hypothetical protein